MDIIKSIEHEQLKNKIPELKVGNTVRVHVRIKEGNKERVQLFQGTVIRVAGSGIAKTFTVRKVVDGVGVERIIPMNSPMVDKIEVLKVGKVRRSKLYYLRGLSGKQARIKELRK